MESIPRVTNATARVFDKGFSIVIDATGRRSCVATETIPKFTTILMEHVLSVRKIQFGVVANEDEVLVNNLWPVVGEITDISILCDKWDSNVFGTRETQYLGLAISMFNHSRPSNCAVAIFSCLDGRATFAVAYTTSAVAAGDDLTIDYGYDACGTYIPEWWREPWPIPESTRVQICKEAHIKKRWVELTLSTPTLRNRINAYLDNEDAMRRVMNQIRIDCGFTYYDEQTRRRAAESGARLHSEYNPTAAMQVALLTVDKLRKYGIGTLVNLTL